MWCRSDGDRRRGAFLGFRFQGCCYIELNRYIVISLAAEDRVDAGPENVTQAGLRKLILLLFMKLGYCSLISSLPL